VRKSHFRTYAQYHAGAKGSAVMAELRCGCVLRVFGGAFAARAFVRRHRIAAIHVWDPGERPAPECPPLDHGGFAIRVSDATDTFAQMNDVSTFLRRHARILVVIRNSRRIRHRWLEVSFSLPAGRGPHSFEIPRGVVERAAQFGLTFHISAIPRYTRR
jgi:hypothetical protein